ncbi:chaplin [Streptomyces sp. NPDC018031]|uniref:chaplin n=1 Tax=Streptomyces sp. NPDC018031 TaxID=3365033 RepID=UPI0037A63DF3
MKRIVRAAGIAAAGCVLVAGGAGAASAHGHDGGGKGHHHAKSQGKKKGQGKKKSHGKKSGYQKHDEYGAETYAVTAGSPGILSGNAIQIPIDVPINVCNNSIGILAAFTVSANNACVNVVR